MNNPYLLAWKIYIKKIDTTITHSHWLSFVEFVKSNECKRLVRELKLKKILKEC